MNSLHIFGLKPSTPLAILPIELTCVLILGRLVMSCGKDQGQESVIVDDRIDVSKDIEVIEEKSEDEKLSEDEENKEE
ncbi:hypothetical protein CK203_009280 [Vitis vinifera]|uniref:Uncharacterized protein n=1 Tax=Vitis vinifera TaxID=29760 RepID=A0A438K2G0_VITVI|nr:hypothetical protein CK203_009280 [Vitis vinifera]